MLERMLVTHSHSFCLKICSQQIEHEGRLPDQFPNDMMSVLSRVKKAVFR